MNTSSLSLADRFSNAMTASFPDIDLIEAVIEAYKPHLLTYRTGPNYFLVLFSDDSILVAEKYEDRIEASIATDSIEAFVLAMALSHSNPSVFAAIRTEMGL
jgi:hypothetical protein